LFIPLIFFFQLPILNRASAQRFPVVLTQQLYQPPQRIVVDHRHDVTVVLDTANFVDVRTTGNIDELDSLRFPDGQLHLSADGLTLSVDSTFPYRSDIRIHTAASKVELEACHFSRLTVSSHNGHPVRLASFEANAYSGSLIFVDVPVVCSEHAVLGAHKEGAVVYDGSVNAPKHDWNLNDGGQVVHRMSDGGSETRRMVQFLPFGLLDRCKLMDNAPIAFCAIELVFAQDGRGVDFVFRYCNRAMEPVEGLTVEQMVDRSFYEVFPKGDRKWIVPYADVAMNGTTRILNDYSSEVQKNLRISCFQPEPGYCACMIVAVDG
jgi:hypothetical protein